MTGGIIFLIIVLSIIGIGKMIFRYRCVVYENNLIKSKVSESAYNWLTEK